MKLSYYLYLFIYNYFSTLSRESYEEKAMMLLSTFDTTFNLYNF